MAYTLCALVARQPVAVVLQAEAGLGAVELAQGFWLLPLDRSARAELGGLESSASSSAGDGFWCLTAGPVSLELGGPDQVDLARSPVNQVLRRLGVLRGEAIDEFDAVGLNRHRSTEDWVKIAAR